MSIKTPLTDEADKNQYGVVTTDFARKLERKLIKANKERILLLNAAAEFVTYEECSCISLSEGGAKIPCSWCIFSFLVEKINKNKGKKRK